MKYLVNGTLRPTKSREDLLARVKNKPLSNAAWELIRKGKEWPQMHRPLAASSRDAQFIPRRGRSQPQFSSTVSGWKPEAAC